MNNKLLVCAIGLGVLGGVAASAGAPAPQEKLSPQAKKNREFYQGRSELAKRVNGVLMTVAVTVNLRKGQADEIQFDWTLEYDGPRPPLIILEPSLERPTGGQTAAVFYAEGVEDERPYEYEVKSPLPGFLGGLAKEWFVTIPKGNKAVGSTRISAGVLRQHYQQHWPEQFGPFGPFPGRNPPPVVYVQFHHRPSEKGHARGEGMNLDAWTGELWSPVLRVPLQNW